MNTKRNCEDNLFEKNKKFKMNNSNNSSNLNHSNIFFNDEPHILSYEKITDTINQYNNNCKLDKLTIGQNSKLDKLTIGQNSKNSFTHSENSAFTVVKKKDRN